MLIYMSELTAEYLDKALQKQTDLLRSEFREANSQLRTEFSEANSQMRIEFRETNDKLRNEFHEANARLRSDLIEAIDERNAELAAMVSRGFDEVGRRFDCRDRIEKLERDFSSLKQALHI